MITQKALYAGISLLFQTTRAKYHRSQTLSLLCSEWEEVVHI